MKTARSQRYVHVRVKKNKKTYETFCDHTHFRLFFFSFFPWINKNRKCLFIYIYIYIVIIVGGDAMFPF